MQRKSRGIRSGRWALVLLVGMASTGLAATLAGRDDPGGNDTLEERVLRGRLYAVAYDCGACHGGFVDPGAEGWLAGGSEEAAGEQFGEFRIRPANLTPDPATGTGRYTERQIFNAVRFGLRPGDTPDVEITSTVPGQGNHPAEPIYLGPGMPWPAFRHIPDQHLWDIVAYLKHGLRPVVNKVHNPVPEDGWASAYPPERIGQFPAPPFPTTKERDPTRVAASAGQPAPPSLEQVLRGRTKVIAHACSACHGGALEPSMEGWLGGLREELREELEFDIEGFRTRPRNLTPDNLTGLGRFSERQIFNALRYGLRPGETPDVEITSIVPGEGNHPMNPKYLAPPMPWPAFRHLPDQDLWDIAAYLKHGVMPVSNRVEDSEGPPDFWAGAYAEIIPVYPLPDFPTARERKPGY
jgi:mono/diheme cytochrome c family protein